MSSCADNWRRRSPDKDRLLGLELRPLAERRLLSATMRRSQLARLLRAALRHRRGEHDVLPPAEGADRAALGARDAARVRLRGQGQPVRDAHQAAARRARAPPEAARADQPAPALTQARPAPLAAAADLPARPRAAPGGAPTRPAPPATAP